MSPLPHYRPKHLSLGPLEAEILELVWQLGCATVKDVHQRLLANPNRELAYTSVTTVLRRLSQKGWLVCDRSNRTYTWTPRISRQDAQMIESHEQLQKFLAISNPDVVAAFADSLDRASLDQIDAIAQRLKAERNARETRTQAEEDPCI